MNSLIQTPSNLFQMIEAIITETPELLSMHNWHELANGKEAFTEDQIAESDTKHCLAGWIIALTPNAPRFGISSRRLDFDKYANEILKLSGRLPIPLAIYTEDEATARKIVAGRAAEERAKAYLVPASN
jgi:hypothetical protein